MWAWLGQLGGVVESAVPVSSSVLFSVPWGLVVCWVIRRLRVLVCCVASLGWVLGLCGGWFTSSACGGRERKRGRFDVWLTCSLSCLGCRLGLVLVLLTLSTCENVSLCIARYLLVLFGARWFGVWCRCGHQLWLGSVGHWLSPGRPRQGTWTRLKWGL